MKKFIKKLQDLLEEASSLENTVDEDMEGAPPELSRGAIEVAPETYARIEIGYHKIRSQRDRYTSFVSEYALRKSTLERNYIRAQEDMQDLLSQIREELGIPSEETWVLNMATEDEAPTFTRQEEE